MSNPLPDWLRLWFQDALITEIYPQIRVIAVSISETRKLTVRYYLDREPTDFDFDSLNMVVSEVLSKTTCDEEIIEVVEECLFSNQAIADIDPLDGIVYARREYEMQDSSFKNP